MPLEKGNCGECGSSESYCPECGSTKVTPLDTLRERKPNSLAAYEGDTEKTYKNVCWDCGWSETVKVTIEVMD